MLGSRAWSTNNLAGEKHQDEACHATRCVWLPGAGRAVESQVWWIIVIAVMTTDQQTLQPFTILETKTTGWVNASVYLCLQHRMVMPVTQGLYRYSYTTERKNSKCWCFLPVCVCVGESMWPALVYIPACVDIIRMLCVRGTPALFFLFIPPTPTPPHPLCISQPVADCNGCFCLMKASKAEVQCLFRQREHTRQCMNPALMRGKKEKKHVINKINSTSPLLVTQHRDQGMW